MPATPTRDGSSLPQPAGPDDGPVPACGAIGRGDRRRWAAAAPMPWHRRHVDRAMSGDALRAVAPAAPRYLRSQGSPPETSRAPRAHEGYRPPPGGHGPRHGARLPDRAARGRADAPAASRRSAGPHHRGLRKVLRSHRRPAAAPGRRAVELRLPQRHRGALQAAGSRRRQRHRLRCGDRARGGHQQEPQRRRDLRLPQGRLRRPAVRRRRRHRQGLRHRRAQDRGGHGRAGW